MYYTKKTLQILSAVETFEADKLTGLFLTKFLGLKYCDAVFSPSILLDDKLPFKYGQLHHEFDMEVEKRKKKKKRREYKGKRTGYS